MPETLTEETTVFDYDELDHRAKANALDWFANQCCADNDWAQSTIDCAKEDGRKYGFEIDDVRYSISYSQGDGASWTGRINLDDFINACIPHDDPHIGAYIAIQAFIKDGWIGEHVDVISRSYYYSHSGGMYLGNLDDNALFSLIDRHDQRRNNVIEADGPLQGANVADLANDIDYEIMREDLERRLIDKAKEFADDIHEQLVADYEWETGEEHFRECIYINGWRFDENGKFVPQ
jgi:hypothetical protein